MVPFVVAATLMAGSPVDAGPGSQPIDPTRLRLLRLAGLSQNALADSLLVHLVGAGSKGLVVDGVRVASLTALVDRNGRVDVRKFIPSTSLGAEPIREIAADECADPAFEQSGATWDSTEMPVAWRLHAESVPKRLRRSGFLRDLRKAHRAWTRADTQCMKPNEASLAFTYAGRTKAGAKPDGINMIEMGPLGKGVAAAIYQWLDGTTLVDSDIRLAKGVGWRTTVRTSGKRHFLVTSDNKFKRHFVVANAVVHGVGSQVGLSALADPHSELSMYGLLERGETKKVSLGTGDMLGAWLVHP